MTRSRPPLRSSSLQEGLWIRDRQRVQDTPKSLEVWGETSRRGRRGGRQVESHLQPVGGAVTVVQPLGRESPPLQVQLVEVLQAVVLVGGGGGPTGPRRVRSLDRSRGAAAVRAGLPRVGREPREGTVEQLRTVAAAELRQAHQQLAVCSQDDRRTRKNLHVFMQIGTKQFMKVK